MCVKIKTKNLILSYIRRVRIKTYKMKQQIFIIVYLVSSFSYSVYGGSPICPENQQLDITSGTLLENNTIVYEGEHFDADEWYNVDSTIISCPCIKRRCVWKCCGNGEVFNATSCDVTEEKFEPPLSQGQVLVDELASKRFYFMYNRLCDNRVLIDTAIDSEEVYLQTNGSLLAVNSERPPSYYASATFCVDYMLDDESPRRLIAGVCTTETPDDDDDSPALYMIYGIGMLLSVPFLLATFVVYAVIPELRNLHGMCLMAYTASLIVAYVLMAYLKVSTSTDDLLHITCITLPFIVYYAFQTSFFWLNVMCYDIWRTFRGYRGSSHRGSTMRRFLAYGAYAWGIPVLLLAFVAFMQFSDNVPEGLIKPNFGQKKCWFDAWQSEMVYFYAPVVVLVVCNSVLFVITAGRIRSIRQETAILKGAESSRNDRLTRDKQRYGLYLKLFTVMGINWTIELITTIVGGSNWYWLVLDMFNVALGFIIFMIFVWKNKVRNLLMRRIRSVRRGPQAPGNSSAGATTWATSTAATDDTRISDDTNMRLRDMH